MKRNYELVAFIALALAPLVHAATAQLPGTPDGDHVVITFASIFENKAAAIETITSMREADGEWRVSGYYIR